MDSIKNKMRRMFKGKKKKVLLSLILVVILICTVFLNTSTVYGKINRSYGSGNITGTIDLEKNVKDNTVLDLLAWFVYVIARFLEWICTKVVGWITAKPMFPWADKIVFNTIPFLDVNFINPQEGSLFLGKDGITIFGTIIQKVYYTIYTLAISSLGIIVGIMAIRLVVSSIAAEKAKYKKAIQNWLLALILVFTVHYLMSFIFFVNEKVVEVASSILISVTQDIKVSNDLGDVSLTQDGSGKYVIKFTDSEASLITTIESSSYIASSDLTKFIRETENILKQFTTDVTEYINKNGLESINKYTIKNYISTYTVGADDKVYDAVNNKLEKRLNNLKKAVELYNSNNSNEYSKYFFTNMSTVFKDNIGSGKKFQPIIAILYSIFVIQSFMYFISYIKRFFYIVVLAMFAPIIVIFDFAQSAIKG